MVGEKMEYKDVILAAFIERVNRFIAHCRLETGELVVVHVKNTGRGKEVLLPGAVVALQHCPAPTRKTSYDLIAVKKKNAWFNIDSQLPNRLAYEGILDGKIILPGLAGEVTLLKREVRFENSKFDLALETTLGEKVFIEVKGMTLENLRIGAFPDAPTLRGKKHVHELADAIKEGYRSYVLFIIQFEEVQLATIHTAMQEELRNEFLQAMADGVQVLAYNCIVEPNTVTVKEAIPFELDYPFIDPN